MKTLVERCFLKLYERELSEEETLMLKKHLQVDMRRAGFTAVDRKLYKLECNTPSYFDIPGVEIWKTHFRVGAYKITVKLTQGKITSRRFYLDGQPWRDGDPAVQEFYENGMAKFVRWVNDDSNAARIPWETAWDEQGNKHYEVWRAVGKIAPNMFLTRPALHREIGPAVSVWYPNGKLRRVEWWHHGSPSRHKRLRMHALNYHENGKWDISEDCYTNTSIYPHLPGVNAHEAFELVSEHFPRWHPSWWLH